MLQDAPEDGEFHLDDLGLAVVLSDVDEALLSEGLFHAGRCQWEESSGSRAEEARFVEPWKVFQVDKEALQSGNHLGILKSEVLNRTFHEIDFNRIRYACIADLVTQTVMFRNWKVFFAMRHKGEITQSFASSCSCFS